MASKVILAQLGTFFLCVQTADVALFWSGQRSSIVQILTLFAFGRGMVIVSVLR